MLEPHELLEHAKISIAVFAVCQTR